MNSVSRQFLTNKYYQEHIIKAEKTVKIQQLKSIYLGNNGDLHKKTKIFSFCYDKKTSKISKIFENSFINYKAGIAEASKLIENLIIKTNKE
jgi:hypothetical protein